jgi:hypothetical protein
MNEQHLSLKETILEQITSGHAKMRPRSYFVIRALLLAIGTTITTLTLLYVISLIVFVTELNGASELPAFGFQGLAPFLLALPWLLIAVCLLSLVLLEILVQRYAFAYRKPLLYSLFGVLIIVIFGSLIVTRLRLHQQLFEYAEEQHLPIAEPFYREYDRHRSRNIYPGVVAALHDDGFDLTTRQAETFTIIVNDKTDIPVGWVIHQGDIVVVLGTEDDQQITALGIRPWRSELGRFRPIPPRDPQ